MIRRTYKPLMLALSIVVLMMFMALNAVPVNSQSQTGFNNQSLKGRYAFTNDVRSLAISLGTLTFDGQGGVVNGNAIGNTLDASAFPFVSVVFPFTFDGSYTVNANGTGVVTFNALLPDGSIKASVFDFVISGYEKQKGNRVATQMRAFGREREQGGATVGVVEVVRLSD